jgi:hypothetical protein
MSNSEGAQVNATVLQPLPFVASDELQALLGKLSARQAAGVIRIAEAELQGIPLEALLEGENKICSRSTFYHKGRIGWIHKPAFQAALEQARREVRAQRMSGAVDEAINRLKETTPLAAEDLRRQIVGDDEALEALGAVLNDVDIQLSERIQAALALGAIGTRRSTSLLVGALKAIGEEKSGAEPITVGEQVYFGLRPALLTALGMSAHGANVQRRMASIAVLDRADKGTADKGPRAGEGVVVYIPDNEREDDSPTPGGAAGAVPGQPG